tara:strand:+ start:468 stop:698 length:231 start_codon:yes stop_codon:yes gene_type:complete
MAEEKMVGVPSMNFIKKIYNLISHKQEKLELINQTEKILEELYNGDLSLAMSQVNNGNFSKIDKSDLDNLKDKQQI